MRLPTFAAAMLVASAVAAQQQPSAPAGENAKPPAPAAKKEGKSDYERRIRTEGAAGGTAPVPEEARQAVGAGAKPHLHDDRVRRGLQRQSDAEVIAPAK
ncbi:MAG TPA: hypothetical protein VF211_04660 [Burkholderiales bacterium]